MRKIYISAGHTSSDPGKVYQDLKETELTRKLAKFAIEYLNSINYPCVAVPLDMFLLQRVDWINQHAGQDASKELLIEFHVNDSDGTQQGMQAWYKSTGVNESQKLAYAILKNVENKLNYKYKLTSEKQHKLGQLSFLSRALPTSVLVETLYIDNPENIKDLKDEAKLKLIAQEVVAGALLYMGLNKKGQPLEKNELLDFSALKPFVPENENDDDLPDDLFNTINSFDSSPAFPKPEASMFLDKQGREQMVNQVYESLLGHAPSAQDLAFFVNQAISKQDLINKVIASQEFKDLLDAKMKLEDLESKLASLQTLVTKLTAENKDNQLLLSQLQVSLYQKNARIAELQLHIQSMTGTPAASYLQNTSAKQTSATANSVPKLKKGIWSSIVKKLS